MHGGIRPRPVEQIFRLRKIDPVIVAGCLPRPPTPYVKIVHRSSAKLTRRSPDFSRRLLNQPYESWQRNRVDQVLITHRAAIRQSRNFGPWINPRDRDIELRRVLEGPGERPGEGAGGALPPLGELGIVTQRFPRGDPPALYPLLARAPGNETLPT